MRIHAALLVLLTVLTTVQATAVAGDPEDPQEALVLRARKAAAANDVAELRAVVASDDPWKVISALCALGDLDVAAGIAAVTKGRLVERAPAHVDEWRAWAGDRLLAAKAYRDVRAGERAFTAGKPADALALLSRVALPPDMPASIEQRLHFALGVVQETLGRRDLVIPEMLAAAKAAERLGWWIRAWTAADFCYQAAMLAGRTQEAAAAAETLFAAGRAAADDAWIATARGKRGAAILFAGRLDEGLEEMRASLAWRAAHPEAGRDLELLVAFNVALVATGHTAEAIPALEAILASPSDLPRWGLRQTAQSLCDAYRAEGRFADAAARLPQVVSLIDDTMAPRDRAAALVGVGFLERVQGNFARALAAYQEAVGYAEASGDDDTILAAYAGLASQLSAVGDLDGAGDTLRRALGHAESRGKARAATTIRTMLGGVEREAGDGRAARDNLLTALQEAKTSGDRSVRAAALAGLGGIESAEGHAEQALAYLTEAVVLAGELRDGPGQARGLAYLGEALVRAGRPAEAVEKCLESERLGGDLGLVEAVVYAQRVRAEALLALGDGRQALTVSLSAVEGLGRLARWHPQERGAGLRESWDELFAVGARAARSLGDVGAFAQILETGRAWSLREVLGGTDALRAEEVPSDFARELAQSANAVRAERLQFERLHDAPDLAAQLAQRGRVRTAEAALAKVEERLESHQRAAASLAVPSPVSLAEIRSSLDPGTALVEHLLVGDEMAALVVTPAGSGGTGAPRIVSLGAVESLAADVGELLSAIAAGPAPEALRDRLRLRVLSPLRLPDGTKRLLVSPDGPLHGVPWRLVMPELEVVEVPSASVMLALTRRLSNPAGDVLALANPIPGAGAGPKSVGVPKRRTGLGRLPEAEEEARAFATVLLVGPEATKSHLRAALSTRPRWRSIHFACHGVLRDAQPIFSGLVLTSDATDDGLLSQGEVLRTRFPTDLVVLSACETAKGRGYRGGGMVGLSRAFLYAGASAVIGSLWRVDDAATRALMTRFYELWRPAAGAAGLPAATALARAQDFVRSNPRWAEARYWAAWVLVGRPD